MNSTMPAANENDMTDFDVGMFYSPDGTRLAAGRNVDEHRNLHGVICIDPSGQSAFAQLTAGQMRQLATVLNRAAALLENEPK